MERHTTQGHGREQIPLRDRLELLEDYPPEPPRQKRKVTGTHVIAAGGCWCGKALGHAWPGKADGAPHPRATA